MYQEVAEGLSVDDVRWLTTGEGRAAYATVQSEMTDGGPRAGQLSSNSLKRLRNDLGPSRLRVLLLQSELRPRARKKFPRADEMLFTRRGLEQATDFSIAQYKASRFAKSLATTAILADLCCGIGGDAIALSRVAQLIGIDRDLVMTWIARHNVDVHGGTCETCCRDVDEASLPDEARSIHIDPDRRTSGRRVTDFAHLVPGPDTLACFAQQSRSLAVKLAPATGAIPASVGESAEREWIETDGECRQQVLWRGGLALDPDRRVATLLQDESCYRYVSPSSSDAEPFPAPDMEPFFDSGNLEQYLYEPRPALLAAGLALHLAAELQLNPLIPQGGYLMGPQHIAHPMLAGFQVQEVLPLRSRLWKDLLAARGVGRLELKQRGTDLDLSRFRRRLKLKGDQGATLIITRQGQARIGILADRLEPVPQ